ncbi:efflux RND transporter periplasmic adaptor subunit [Lysobacter brunescens]|uniref:Efflux RND transporter periplasmic adaptor subunit n=1 Tax=Lysobacter brunescens TaxID=262323 RepID=A0ABW2Y9V0_9GAMM
MSSRPLPVSVPVVRLPLLALVAALVLAGCSGDVPEASQAAAASSAMAVTTAPVEMRDLARTVLVSGAVAPVEEMQLGVEVSGLRVTELLVDVGQSVRRGQVLLRLDRRMLDSELRQAEAALREAEAGAALARANLARGENLARERYISAGQLDELRAVRTQAEARVGTARAGRDAAALRHSFAELRAPADGIVSKRLVQPGQVVGAGGELLRLIRDGRLEWRAELPVTQLSSVKPGDRIALRGPGGVVVEGRVRAVSPGVDAATRTGTVYADLPDPKGLAAGAYLEGRIDTGRARVATVPAAAVVLRDGFATLYTIATKEGATVAEARRVRTGAREGAHVELLDGPKPGQQVVVKGAGFLADGDAVRVVPATQAAPAAGVAR